MSSLLTGQYGLEDLCLSLPAIMGRDGVSRIIDFSLSAEEETQLKHSGQVLKEIISGLQL